MTMTHTPAQGDDDPTQTMTVRYGDGNVTTLRAVPIGDGRVTWEGESPDHSDGRVSLLGFSVTVTPEVSGYPETYRPPLFYMADRLPELEALRGMFAQFGGKFGMFGWGVSVAEVIL